MNDINDTHAPTPEFRAMLERDLLSAYRRENQFASSRAGTLRRVRTVFVLTIGLILGVGSGFASAQVQDARQRDLIEAAAAMQRQLRTLRIELARTQYERAKRLYETGALTRDALLGLETELRAMEVALERLDLELAESRRTSSPARDELWAPKVDGRDFVKERLLLEASIVEKKLRAVEAEDAEKEKMVRLGVITKSHKAEVEAEKLRAVKEMELVAEKIRLRDQFFNENLAAEEVERRIQAAEIGKEVLVLQELIKAATEQLATARERFKVGVINELELRKVEVQVLERKMELEKLVLQLKLVERRKQ